MLAVLFPALPARAEKLTLNLKGADINTLIETVSEATGRNFVVDPKVTGKVTVVSSQPMSTEELYRVFLSILEVHGFIAVPSGQVIKIVPDNNLKYSGTPITGPRSADSVDGDEVVVRVYDIKHVDAARLLPVLRPLVSPKGHLASYGDNNLLIVSDYADSVKRLGRIISRVDQPVTDEIEVIALEHASASELARVVGNMLKADASGGPKNAIPSLVADERSNSLLVGGDRIARLRLRAIVAHLDIPVAKTGNTRVIHLRFANAKDLAGVLTSMGEHYLRGDKTGKETATSIVNVQAYEESNALVVTAPPTLLSAMEEVIRRLDVRRAQVQVEAIIAEVSTDNLSELGIEWGILRGQGDNTGFVGGTNFPSPTNPGLVKLGGSLAQGLRNPGQTTAAAETAAALANSSGLILGATTGGNSLATLLRAINNVAGNNVLSTPTLITLDNEEAEIVVGSEVPFITGQTSGTGNDNPFTTITRKNVGLILKVTPQINEGDTIRLKIEQETSRVSDAAVEAASDVVTDTRSIKTTVLVDDGQLLVLGGLIKNDVKRSIIKVPLLGDVPLLGAFFRTESARNERTNLMVFLRPSILRTKESGQVLTGGKYRYIREQQYNLPQPNWPVSLSGASPLLPELPVAMPAPRTSPAEQVARQSPNAAPWAPVSPSSPSVPSPPPAGFSFPKQSAPAVFNQPEEKDYAD